MSAIPSGPTFIFALVTGSIGWFRGTTCEARRFGFLPASLLVALVMVVMTSAYWRPWTYVIPDMKLEARAPGMRYLAAYWLDGAADPQAERGTLVRLGNASHTLKIKNLNTPNPASTGNELWVADIRSDNDLLLDWSNIYTNGNFVRRRIPKQEHPALVDVGSPAGTIEATISGSVISVCFREMTTGGKAEVSVDGRTMIIDTYGTTDEIKAIYFTDLKTAATQIHNLPLPGKPAPSIRLHFEDVVSEIQMKIMEAKTGWMLDSLPPETKMSNCRFSNGPEGVRIEVLGPGAYLDLPAPPVRFRWRFCLALLSVLYAAALLLTFLLIKLSVYATEIISEPLSSDPIPKWEPYIVLGIATTSAIAYFMTHPSVAFFDSIYHYIPLSERFPRLWTYNEAPVLHTPGYPIFLKIMSKLGSYGTMVPLVQQISGICVVYMSWELARLCAGRWFALAAAVFIAIDPFRMFYANSMLTEALTTFFVTTIVWLIVKHEHKRSLLYSALTGAVIAGAMLLRPSLQVFFSLVFLLLISTKRCEFSRALRHFAITLAVATVLLLPWLTFNYLRDIKGLALGRGRQTFLLASAFDTIAHDYPGLERWWHSAQKMRVNHGIIDAYSNAEAVGGNINLRESDAYKIRVLKESRIRRPMATIVAQMDAAAYLFGFKWWPINQETVRSTQMLYGNPRNLIVPPGTFPKNFDEKNPIFRFYGEVANIAKCRGWLYATCLLPALVLAFWLKNRALFIISACSIGFAAVHAMLFQPIDRYILPIEPLCVIVVAACISRLISLGVAAYQRLPRGYIPEHQ